MHFTHAVAIFISCELTPSMVDMLMTVAPGLQTGINAVLISINKCAWINSVFDQRLDGLLLHVREQIDHDLTTTLHHPKDRWSFLLHSASSTFTFVSASTTCAALLLHHLWLSLMASNHIGFITLHLIRHIEPHEIQTQDPDFQRLMMSRKNGVGQIIKASVTVVTLITLAGGFCVIKAALDDLFRLTRGTC